MSGPLLDRIDLQVEVPRIALTELGSDAAAGESSAVVRARVCAAREAQMQRAGKANARLSHREVQRDCALAPSDRALLERALDKLGLYGRAYQCILRVARRSRRHRVHRDHASRRSDPVSTPVAHLTREAG